MEKKTYISPELKVLGDVAQITQGNGWRGNADTWQLLCFEMHTGHS